MNYQVNWNEQYWQVQVRNKKVEGKVIVLVCSEGMKGEWRYSSTYRKVKIKFKILYRDWFSVANLIRNKHICLHYYFKNCWLIMPRGLCMLLGAVHWDSWKSWGFRSSGMWCVVLLGGWFIFGEALDSLTVNMKVILHMSGTTHLITASCSTRLDCSALLLWKLQI